MRPPEVIETIPPTKIAVESHIDLEEIRFQQRSQSLKSLGDVVRLPKDPELVYFANETSRFYERMQLIDALELQILPNDPENTIHKLEFTWDLIAYDEDNIQIQLHFINPYAISDDSALDKLSVTFWGVEFFKS